MGLGVSREEPKIMIDNSPSRFYTEGGRESAGALSVPGKDYTWERKAFWFAVPLLNPLLH